MSFELWEYIMIDKETLRFAQGDGSAGIVGRERKDFSQKNPSFPFK